MESLQALVTASTTRASGWVYPRRVARRDKPGGSLCWALASCRLAAAVVGLFALLTPGCVGLEKLMVSKNDVPPTGRPCQIEAIWDNQVIFTPDPANGGKQTPGIACRLYLYGETIGTPMVCEGKAVVELYDVGDAAKEANPVLKEVWNIDKDTLKRLQRRDMIGWGYTLFLPWGTYRPDIRKIDMKIRYEPVQGTPLFTDSSKITLKDSAEKNTVRIKNESTPLGAGAPGQATARRTPPN